GYGGGAGDPGRRRRTAGCLARATVQVQPASDPAQLCIHCPWRSIAAVAGLDHRRKRGWARGVFTMSSRGHRDIRRLLDIMARLRDPEGGCPWDLEQDFASLAPFTIEEAYEVADATDRGDMDGAREGLGDPLQGVVVHSRMAEEAGHFAFRAVVAAICDKVVSRHPHGFGDADVEDAAAQTRQWEEHKRREREARGERD